LESWPVLPVLRRKADVMSDARIGILGGTFNPIHYGHLRISEEAREGIGLGKILFIPSGTPPLKAVDLAPVKHRFEMTKLAIETNPLFRISDIECVRREKSYTVETLAELNRQEPGKEFYFILGIDAFLEIPLWRDPGKLMELTNFAVVSRPGFSFSDLSSLVTSGAEVLSALDARELKSHRTTLRGGRDIVMMNVTRMDISATAVRSLVRQGMSTKYLLPEQVESYIISHNLYSEGSDHL
jgi:nicotinate-nucleotide adenylyltransferase